MGRVAAAFGVASSKDAIGAQAHITNREAFRRLNEEHGFMEHFQNLEVDTISRLAADASLEDGFAEFKTRVDVGFDPADGIIRMSVRAFTPETSVEFSNALLHYATEWVDTEARNLRNDQMAGANQLYANAETAFAEAQAEVLRLQEARGIMSAEAEVGMLMSIINSLETELEARRLQLFELLENARPNQARVNSLNAEIERLEARVSELRLEMTDSTTTDESLAAISAELSIAETNLATRQVMLQTALQQVEAARLEANRNVAYLSLSVRPIPPDVATHPKKFESTLLALVIFFGLYIFVSLTVSILREQVSV